MKRDTDKVMIWSFFVLGEDFAVEVLLKKIAFRSVFLNTLMESFVEGKSMP